MHFEVVLVFTVKILTVIKTLMYNNESMPTEAPKFFPSKYKNNRKHIYVAILSH